MERCPQWDNHSREYDLMGLVVPCCRLKNGSGKWLVAPTQKTEKRKMAFKVWGWSSTFLILS